jgi:hypothetical protein
VFLVCFSPWLFAQDATVYMRSGISLPPGSVVEIESGILRYKSEFGELIIPVEQIDQIVFDGGSKGREGIVLSTSDWISGVVQQYSKGVWNIETNFGRICIEKPGLVTSVNFSKPQITAFRGLSKSGLSYRLVLDWLYSHEVVVFQNKDEWSCFIHRISLANNQILVEAAIQSKGKMQFLSPRFSIEDEFGNRYQPILSTFSDGEYSYIEPKQGQVVFPVLKEGSKTMTLFVGHNTATTPTPRIDMADLLAY